LDLLSGPWFSGACPPHIVPQLHPLPCDLGSVLQKLHEGEDVLPDQTANGAGALHPNGNRTVRAQHITRAMEHLPTLLIQAPRHPGYCLTVCAIAYGEIQPTLCHSLLGILLRVHGGRNHLHAFVLEPARSGKGRELLPAVRSPVTAVQEDNPPHTRQIVGEAHRPAPTLVNTRWGNLSPLSSIFSVIRGIGSPPLCNASQETSNALAALSQERCSTSSVHPDQAVNNDVTHGVRRDRF